MNEYFWLLALILCNFATETNETKQTTDNYE